MSNSYQRARHWTEFIASRPEFLCGELLLRQFAAGQITRLCDCGCNSYDIVVSSNEDFPSLVVGGGRGGLVFQMEFNTNEPGKTVEVMVFADKAGFLAGLEVDYCGNNLPMPECASLSEPPFHIYGILAREVQSTDGENEGEQSGNQRHC